MFIEGLFSGFSKKMWKVDSEMSEIYKSLSLSPEASRFYANDNALYYNNYRVQDSTLPVTAISHSWNNVTPSNYCTDLLSKEDYCSGQILVPESFISTNNSNGVNQEPVTYYGQLSQFSHPCPNSSPEHEDEENDKFTNNLFTNLSKKPILVPAVRVIKKRNTANKKERRRTQSINNAFTCLREKIPNVPYDTKLSKIKTLKLAILYIKYLVEVIDGDQDPKTGFRADLKPAQRKGSTNDRRSSYLKHEHKNCHRPNKGRTGWPQDVWASELLPDQK